MKYCPICGCLLAHNDNDMNIYDCCFHGYFRVDPETGMLVQEEF